MGVVAPEAILPNEHIVVVYTSRRFTVFTHDICATKHIVLFAADKMCCQLSAGQLQSINQFSGPAYPWGVAGAAAQVGASKHLDPLQHRIDALLGCQGETN